MFLARFKLLRKTHLFKHLPPRAYLLISKACKLSSAAIATACACACAGLDPVSASGDRGWIKSKRFSCIERCIAAVHVSMTAFAIAVATKLELARDRSTARMRNCKRLKNANIVKIGLISMSMKDSDGRRKQPESARGVSGGQLRMQRSTERS